MEQCIFDRIIWTIYTSWLVQTNCSTLETQVLLTSQRNFFLVVRQHVKQKWKQHFEEQKENPRWLQRYVDDSLAFHLLEILYPVIMLSQEKKEMWKNKDRIRFCLLPECMSTRHIHGALYSTTPGLGVWELVYLCDGAAPCCHSKSGSGKAKASLAPSQLAWRRLHGYGRKLNGRWDLTSAGIKPATI